ncbi:ATPase domain-containing protein [Klebsiella variicola]|uniref:nucleotide-binding protein n=1 Tax=Klebsiella variicola TaxID=244366 RepID=UPI00125A160D|nr:ATPase domain-containing protein [Klebsiella variicola]
MASYVLWANKGGIGKSTLTFQLACKYARTNSEIPTFVIDLSPQCDVSRMLLGGGAVERRGKNP